MRHTRFLPAAAFALALLPAVAQAQDDFGIPTVSGDWFAPGGTVTIGGWWTDLKLTGVLDGKGTFNGSSLTYTPEVNLGMKDVIMGPVAGPEPAAPITFKFSEGSSFDWLESSTMKLYRAHSKDNVNGPWTKPEPLAITPERISGLYDNLRDVLGNNDRIANDGPEPNLTDAQKLQAAMDFLAKKEKDWGEPVTDLKASDFPSTDLYNFFRAEKAIELTRYGRTPDQVKDYYLNVSGSVEGQTVNPRKVFAQLWKSKTGPATAVGVVVPGYRDTIRTFEDQINEANAAGSDMLAMDAQWGSWTQGGHSGGVDSGQGIARDSYAVAGWAKQEFPNEKLFMMGSSLGGGSGTLGMLTDAGQGQIDATINDGKTTISGRNLVPGNTPAIVQAPFLAMKSDLGSDWQSVKNAFAQTDDGLKIWKFDFSKLDSNDFAKVWGKVPFLKTTEFHSEATAPNDGVRQDDLKTLLTREDGSASQAEAMDATLPFASETVEKIQHGLGPTGPVYFIHAKDDTLAQYSTSYGVYQTLKNEGRPVEFTTLDSSHHTFWNDLSEQPTFLQYLQKIIPSAKQ